MCWPIPASRLLDKLATLPLGTVLDRSSGSYKNIIVERVDSIETTLAHLLPEMTANIVGALAVLVLLFLEDWRMGLSMLIVVPLGILCFMSMFSGYQREVSAHCHRDEGTERHGCGIHQRH